MELCNDSQFLACKPMRMVNAEAHDVSDKNQTRPKVAQETEAGTTMTR